MAAAAAAASAASAGGGGVAPPAKRKKGMSLEEKRDTMLAICVESKDVFNLKDLEKLGSKAGVVLQTIKDVVQSLVDDRLIEVDKIGSGNFYWAFPSQAYMALKSRVEALEARIAAENAAIASLRARLAELTAGRDDGAERSARLAELVALKAEREEMDRALRAHADSDPAALAALQAKAATAKAACDRWTDNVWAVKSYMMDKFGKAPSEVDAMMGIPEEFDYLA